MVLFVKKLVLFVLKKDLNTNLTNKSTNIH